MLPELFGDHTIPGGMQMSREHLFYLRIFTEDEVKIIPHRIVRLIVGANPVVWLISDLHG